MKEKARSLSGFIGEDGESGRCFKKKSIVNKQEEILNEWRPRFCSKIPFIFASHVCPSTVDIVVSICHIHWGFSFFVVSVGRLVFGTLDPVLSFLCIRGKWLELERWLSVLFDRYES